MIWLLSPLEPCSDVTLRVVQLQLGDKILELTEYSSGGNPIPVETRSNDRWVQHLTIVVSDMDQANLYTTRLDDLFQSAFRN